MSKNPQFSDKAIIEAHKHSGCHRNKLEKDDKCGCFFCLTIFSPNEIEKWVDSHDTAICPYCGIDSVIGESSGFPITKEFLKEMQKHWF